VGVVRDDLLSHAHVLEAVAEVTSVVPVQFGVLMPDEETVRRELLEAGREQTVTLLRAFEGLVQLTVTGRYDEEDALTEVVRRDPELAAMHGAADDVSSKMQLGEAVAAGLEQLRAADSDLLVQRLAPLARAYAFNESRDAYTVTGLALLVERSSREALDRAVAEVGEELSSRLRLRYVGPQPPYSFLDAVETQEQAWG
jgi:hypothetical protein